MPSQGPLSAGTGTSSGSPAWTNPTRIVASDDLKATVNVAALGTSGTLLSGLHGFTIPTDATIDGIVPELERSGDSNISTLTIRLAKAGVAVGDNKSAAGDWPGAASEAYITYGSATDLWGTTWTPAEINASGFGFVVAVQNSHATNVKTARVDHVRITVYYTEAGGGGAVALAGTSAGTSTDTGALALAIALAGTSAGASTDTGALSVDASTIALAGNSAGVSTDSATLAVAIALLGTSAGASDDTLALLVPRVLSGTSVGTSADTLVWAFAATPIGALQIRIRDSATLALAISDSAALALAIHDSAQLALAFTPEIATGALFDVARFDEAVFG